MNMDGHENRSSPEEKRFTPLVGAKLVVGVDAILLSLMEIVPPDNVPAIAKKMGVEAS